MSQHGSPRAAGKPRIQVDNCHSVKNLIGPLLVTRETNWFDRAGGDDDLIGWVMSVKRGRRGDCAAIWVSANGWIILGSLHPCMFSPFCPKDNCCQPVCHLDQSAAETHTQQNQGLHTLTAAVTSKKAHVSPVAYWFTKDAKFGKGRF